MTVEVKSQADAAGRSRLAYQFITLMGIVSFFGDITYEGGRSIAGPYLATLGASAAMVGFASGLGEFAGYALRLVSGYVADRTRAYWAVAFVGYGLLVAIPLLAFTQRWQVAALLVILERVGKGIRTPARDTLLSHATAPVGRGWGFAIHEAIDQFGAVIGPLIFTAAFLLGGGYRQGFTWLWLPALATLGVLSLARWRVPHPELMEDAPVHKAAAGGGWGGLPRVFWVYGLFIFLTVAGFANFQLISYHLSIQGVASEALIPLLYAVAMGVDAIVALIIGKTYDRIGLGALNALPLLALPVPLLALTGSLPLAVVGIVAWGAVMGIHETIIRAAIADLTPRERRGIAYGLFNTIYGGAFFVGSTAMGVLYGISPLGVGVLAVALQVLALVVLRRIRGGAGEGSTG